ncbi:MAG: hypothetical protein BMS9Abin36_1433 [Gammaproteobacteria bacterium]|nr:MAG: hypothetical protein BMS9Abin36_1433 [Gammaproteobacteria bacterium]
MRHRLRRLGKDPAELNITAFMNLMVILVPFLLITAVFSRITILELNLPAASSGKSKPPKQELQLEVIIRSNSLEVADGRMGLIKRVRNTSAGYDYKALSKVLRQLKSRFPQKQNAMILAQSTTPYETLVHTMDAVRSVEVVQGASVVRAELFPDISIGDAPRPSRKSRKKKG